MNNARLRQWTRVTQVWSQHIGLPALITAWHDKPPLSRARISHQRFWASLQQYLLLFWKIGHISQNMNGCSNDTGASHYDLPVSVAEINFVIIIAIHQNESITCWPVTSFLGRWGVGPRGQPIACGQGMSGWGMWSPGMWRVPGPGRGPSSNRYYLMINSLL